MRKPTPGVFQHGPSPLGQRKAATPSLDVPVMEAWEKHGEGLGMFGVYSVYSWFD